MANPVVVDLFTNQTTPAASASFSFQDVNGNHFRRIAFRGAGVLDGASIVLQSEDPNVPDSWSDAALALTDLNVVTMNYNSLNMRFNIASVGGSTDISMQAVYDVHT